MTGAEHRPGFQLTKIVSILEKKMMLYEDLNISTAWQKIELNFSLRYKMVNFLHFILDLTV